MFTSVSCHPVAYISLSNIGSFFGGGARIRKTVLLSSKTFWGHEQLDLNLNNEKLKANYDWDKDLKKSLWKSLILIATRKKN